MDPVVQVLLQSGASGLVAIVAGFVIRTLFTRMVADHDQETARLSALVEVERQRADRLDQELSRLNGAIQVGYVDTIVKASTAINEATRAVADALAAVRRS